MRKFLKFLFVLYLLLYLICFSSAADAQSFIKPMDHWKEKYFSDGHGKKIEKNVYHIGTDIIDKAGTKVRSIGEGIVKHVQVHMGFGTVVLVEHILKSGKKVVALYGHLREKKIRVAEGEKVNRGYTIGELGDKKENGGYKPHLHFGVRKGDFIDPEDDWVYWGRTTNKKVLRDWYDPVSFVRKKEYRSSYDTDRIVSVPDHGAAHVQTFRLNEENGSFNRILFESNFRGGADVAIGNVDRDKEDEIIIASGSGRPTEIQIFTEKMKRKAQFYPFGKDYTQGARVSVGDVDGDKIDEVIAATVGHGHVRIFDKDRPKPIDYFPFGTDHRGGIDVDSGNFDKDEKDEIVISNLSHGQAWIKIYDYNAKRSIKGEFRVFRNDFFGGARIKVGNFDSDEENEILAGMSESGGLVSVYEKNGTQKGIVIFPYGNTYNGGVSVSAIDFEEDGKDEIITVPAGKFPSILKVFKYNSKKEVILEKNMNDKYIGGFNVD